MVKQADRLLMGATAVDCTHPQRLYWHNRQTYAWRKDTPTAQHGSTIQAPHYSSGCCQPSGTQMYHTPPQCGDKNIKNKTGVEVAKRRLERETIKASYNFIIVSKTGLK